MLEADPLIKHAEDLAAALAADELLSTIVIDCREYPVTFLRPEVATVDIADDEIKTPLVWVVEVSETLGSDRSPTYDERELLIVAQMKAPSEALATVTAQAMDRLTAAITRFMRPIDGCLNVNGAVCVRAFRKAKDAADWQKNDRYFSEIVTTWRG